MPDFPIVDSHVHLFDPARLPYPWMRGLPFERRMEAAEFDAACAPVQVAQIVFVEVAVAAGRHLDEAAYVQGLAQADPRVAGIVAHAPVERGAAVEADLAALAANPALRGIRRLIQGEVDPGICLHPDFLAGVRAVGRAGLPFDICIKHWGMVFAIELARRCPEVTFVLDHIGKPGIAHGLREPWWSQTRTLAALPNVVCKLSGVITEADHAAWTAEAIAPYVTHAIECFGFDRVMYGSDWPVSSLTHSYADWVALLDRCTAGCSRDEVWELYCGTASRVYRLG
jgi:L-fuconolactonase